MSALDRYFESFLDILSDGVFISDPDGKVLRVNRMYEALTGICWENVKGKNVRDLVAEGLFDHIVNPQVVATGKTVTRVQQLSNGKRLVLTGVPLFAESGKLCLVVTFARDVTVLAQMHSEMSAQRKLIDQYHDQLAFMAREQAREQVGGRKTVCVSRPMREAMALLDKLAVSDATVLLLGETGVGKDVAARRLHEQSARRNNMFLKVDCGSIAENLIESELFGYAPGAFTGARNKGRTGCFELADGGTLFLDEIGELRPDLQTRLLRVLQDGEIVRVGESRPRTVNVRIVAATNRDLAARVEEGLFRRDLFYRLQVAFVQIPPLRERPEDIKPLGLFFLDDYCVKYQKKIIVSPHFFEALRGYAWPGNVRELQNLIHRMVITRDGGMLTRSDLPAELVGDSEYSESVADFSCERPLREIMRELEQKVIRQAIRKYGSMQNAAQVLEVNRSTLFRKLHTQK